MENVRRRWIEPEDLRIRYLNPEERTEDQRLTIDTCPGYDQALDRALDDYYREKKCRDCHIVSAEVIAGASRVNIRGNCPKV